MTEAALGCLGVMIGQGYGNSAITEPAFCSHLCRAARKYGLEVFVFHPEGVASDGSSVSGYGWKNGGWHSVVSSPPDIVYNRCFYGSMEGKRKAAAALSTLPRPLLWSRGLPDKWGVYETLRRNRRAAALLPETKLYAGSRSLDRMLAEREDGVFLKPKAGSHGKRTLHARRNHTGACEIIVKGRDRANLPFHHSFDTREEGMRWINDFIGTRRYIMQPYLHLSSRGGQPFDVRVLMQKNGRGHWMLTGMAVRVGKPGSTISNLHGGGTAVAPLPFLTSEYGPYGKAIMEDLTAEAAFLPPLLEETCGRLGELGLDFGVDAGGRIYLLEANSKPGRTVFQLTGDFQALRLASENPLRYAQHLLLTRQRNPALPENGSVINGKMISMVPKEDS